MSLSRTYSIAEWYGNDITKLSVKKRQKLAGVSKPSSIACPFSSGGCNKKGGVCSIRAYSQHSGSEWLVDGCPVATCPRRFDENGTVTDWISDFILGETAPRRASEVPFLAGIAHDGGLTGKKVGKIDMVLVGKGSDPLKWCAVEVQAVYFSGDNMGVEFSYLKKSNDVGIPTPQGQRRPDFRSSGPKRLMPQLQTKVPSISRWGHKMAVVIDRAFWNSLSPMDEVGDVSNSDVAWFVTDYENAGDRIVLTKGSVHLTTLARAVEGLTAGNAVPLSDFEAGLKEKLGL